MAHSVQIAAITMAILAFVIVIITLETEGWLKGCVSYKHLGNSSNNSIVQSPKNLKQNGEESYVCAFRGLLNFRLMHNNEVLVDGKLKDDYISCATRDLLISTAVFLALGTALSAYNAFSPANSKMNSGVKVCMLAGGFSYFLSCVLSLSAVGLFTSSHKRSFVVGAELNARLNSLMVSRISNTTHDIKPQDSSNYVSTNIDIFYDYSYGLCWAAVVLVVLCTFFVLHSLFEKFCDGSKHEHDVVT